MRRVAAAASLAALMGSVSACYGAGRSMPTEPTGTIPVPAADAVVIDIVGINGAQSFSPNPSTVPAGRLVVWHNTDTATHRVVFNDGEVDTGNIAPGASSAPTALVAVGPYHCSIHPPMIGTTVQ